MNYFDQFKRERYHDHNLIKLVKFHCQNNDFAAVNKFFQTDCFDPGNLIDAYRKKDYDVHFEFEKAVVCVETKVDSYENEYYQESLEYQTQRAYEKYRSKFKKKTYFRYLTYGASEFYIKKAEDGSFRTGPFSRHFRHLKLEHVIEFLNGSAAPAKLGDLREWRDWLIIEQERRTKWLEILKSISQFRKLYLGSSGLTDWPNNRVNICIPEVLLHFYSKVAESWNSSEFSKNLGCVTVYPVCRPGKVNDAILNFSELNEAHGFPFSLDGLLSATNSLYFEFNEDFNLHLKCLPNVEADEMRIQICDFLTRNQERLSLSGECKTTPENYKQWSYVFFEWDLNILDYLNDIQSFLPRLNQVLCRAVEVLK